MEYELKVTTPKGKSKVVTWDGSDGLNACERYADCNRGFTVTAWRDVQYGIFPGVLSKQIIG